MFPAKPEQAQGACPHAVPSAKRSCSPAHLASDRLQSTRWCAYVVASGAAASTALGAGAGIVYSGPRDNVYIGATGGGLDFNGDGSTDMFIVNFFGPANLLYQKVFAYPGAGFVGFTAGPSNDPYVSALASGSQVDASTVGTNAVGWLAYANQRPNAQFINASNKYLGFSFATTGGTRYGWMRVSINNPQGTLIVHDWAYEDSGAGIGAGVVPAPGALGLLAAGAAGLGRLRGRKRS